jgi:cob(I)alamin adenosyltransferase
MAFKIYTKTGDKGTTALFGGTRVSKHSIRIETYGTVDELNATIGLTLAEKELPESVRQTLLQLSSLLFSVGADLATPLNPAPTYPIPRIQQSHSEWLEQFIDAYDEELEPLKNFILPGGTKASAYLHLARTVCRRAERLAVYLSEQEEIGDAIIPFLNRLSDYLFTAARYVNFKNNIDDVQWINPNI